MAYAPSGPFRAQDCFLWFLRYRLCEKEFLSPLSRYLFLAKTLRRIYFSPRRQDDKYDLIFYSAAYMRTSPLNLFTS